MCYFGFVKSVNNDYFWYNVYVCEVAKRYNAYVSEMAKIWFCNTGPKYGQNMVL